MRINTCFLIPVISELKVKLIFNKYEMNSYYQQQKYPTISSHNYDESTISSNICDESTISSIFKDSVP